MWRKVFPDGWMLDVWAGREEQPIRSHHIIASFKVFGKERVHYWNLGKFWMKCIIERFTVAKCVFLIGGSERQVMPNNILHEHKHMLHPTTE